MNLQTPIRDYLYILYYNLLNSFRLESSPVHYHRVNLRVRGRRAGESGDGRDTGFLPSVLFTALAIAHHESQRRLCNITH